MINFSSIVTDMQIKIAEKMDYFDQDYFERSSKHGKDVMKLTKREAVVDLKRITIFGNEVRLSFKNKKIKDKSLNHLCQQNLPRFRVSLMELVELKGEAISDQVSVFGHLPEMVYIKKLYCGLRSPDLDPKLFTLPVFRKIDHVQIIVRDYDALLQLTNPKLTFYVISEYSRAVSTAHRYFEEWFHSKRRMEWFVLKANDYLPKTEKLFSGLPHSIICECERGGRTWDVELLKANEFYFGELKNVNDGSHNLHRGETVYAIDRGDKKLIVFISRKENFIIAQECYDQEEVIKIERGSLKRKRSRSRSSPFSC